MSEFDIILREGQFFVDRTASTIMDLLYVGDGETPLSELKPVGGSFSIPPADGQTYSMCNGQWVPNVLLGDDHEPVQFAGIPSVGSNDGSAGEIRTFLLLEAPKGWLECDGSRLLKADYPKLYTALEALDQGFVIDEQAFLLPDLRGEFIRGRDIGRAVGTMQEDALQNITAYFGFRWGCIDSSGGGGAFLSWGRFNSLAAVKSDPNNPSNSQGDFDASRVARTSDETRPRNIAACVCIKY